MGGRGGVLLGVYHGFGEKAVIFFGVYHWDLNIRRCLSWFW
jgi:hypothetical protein